MIIDKTLDNIVATSSTRGVTRNLDIPYSTVWKILRKIIQLCQYMSSPVQELRHIYHDKWLTIVPTFFAKMKMDDVCHGKFYGETKLTFS